MLSFYSYALFSLYLRRILLQSSNINWSLFRRLQITSTDTQIRGRTNHATSQTQRVVGKNGLSRSIIVFVRNAGDETLHIQLSWTGFLARSIGTLQTTGGLFESASFRQSGVFYVGKIIFQWRTRLKKRINCAVSKCLNVDQMEQ